MNPSRGPEIDKLVRLRVPDWGEDFASRVVDAVSQRLVVAAPSDGRRAYGLQVGMPVEIGWMTAAGVAWIPGIVVVRAAGEAAFAVQLLGPPVILQRREHIRAHALIDIELLGIGGGVAARGTTLDLSGGGMRALLPHGMAVGDVGRFSVPLPEERPVSFTARVVRQAGEHALGFRFELISAPDRERLTRHAFLRVRDDILRRERAA